MRHLILSIPYKMAQTQSLCYLVYVIKIAPFIPIPAADLAKAHVFDQSMFFPSVMFFTFAKLRVYAIMYSF